MLHSRWMGVRISYTSRGADEVEFVALTSDRGGGRYAPDSEIRGEAIFRNGRVVIETLTIGRREGLNVRTLREVPLGAIRDRIELDHREHPEWFGADVDSDVRPLLAEEVEPLSEILRRLRRNAPQRGRADNYYADVARAYLALLGSKTSQPIKTLTSELRRGKRHATLSENTVASWVRVARARGWLTEAQHGRAAADPGPLLIALWEHLWQEQHQSKEAE